MQRQTPPVDGSAPTPGTVPPLSDPRPPAVSLPKGGGAIRGIGEKFTANPATGAGSMTVPIATTGGRDSFGPTLALTYDSAAGNGSFGLGWTLGLPAITRKTERGLPRYTDGDVFVLAGAEDLVPVPQERDEQGAPVPSRPRVIGGAAYRVQAYRPRVEGLFARIERWTNLADPADVCWRSISRDNVTTWYGRTDESRISDPADARRVFSWLICESHDDRGNVVTYGYKGETGADVDPRRAAEQHRERRANRYPKRIRYGNHVPYRPVLRADRPWPRPPGDGEWYFEVVFDYGEHDATRPVPADAPDWPARPDPFSVYRAGFEIRTHRLCRRVLTFHHFPDQPQVRADCLVRSTDFGYAHDGYAKLTTVTQRGYRRTATGYRSRSLPPVELGYTAARLRGELRVLDADSWDNVPAGVDGSAYRWVDLDGEGLPGILTEQGGGWFYKRNLSPLAGRAAFAPGRAVAPRPAPALAGAASFVDLAGDGRPDVVWFGGPVAGFHERTLDEDWAPFTAFRSRPTVNWTDPGLSFVDLDGDGRADLLVTDHQAPGWHPSLGEHGFGPRYPMTLAGDELRGPVLVRTDGEQAVHFADMTGDGLSDLVRVRNGEICYWPNVGRGRFGAKVTMDDAPLLDRAGRFDPARIRLADVDGSGTTDLIYLHADGVRVWLNQSGNGWGAPVTLAAGLPTASPADVQVVDLLGTGTACLVWSSPLPADARRPMRYLDLVGGPKPHLLVTVRNNLGAETEVEYAPSTAGYLRDQAAGTPWATKLPFPVHVVERVTVRDRWRGTTFTSRYRYHHGYFDGPEREFRGFGRVEQVDVEDFGTYAAANADSPYVTVDGRLLQPPVKTVTWFHLGAQVDAERILHQFEREYFPSRYPLGDYAEHRLPEPVLDPAIRTAQERREALRACRGLPLRQEVYELDAAALGRGEHRPVRLFSAATYAYQVRMQQPTGDSAHAVFHTVPTDTLTYRYELDLRAQRLVADPRITHTLHLDVDEYGNVRQSVTVGYPRRLAAAADPLLPPGTATLVAAVQGEAHLRYIETRLTADIPSDPDVHRLRRPCESRGYELTGVPAGPDGYHTMSGLREYQLSDRYPGGSRPVGALGYHQSPDGVRAQKRLVEHTRELFFDESLAGPLPLGELNALALPYESYALTLTDDLLAAALGARRTAEVGATLQAAGYLTDDAGRHWRRSGIAGFDAQAAAHFLLPSRYTDAFGAVTTVEHDPADLYVRSVTDPLDNRSEVVEFDFRVLAPTEVRDANGTRNRIAYDVLGRPVLAAVIGKHGEGDRLDDAGPDMLDPPPDVLADFFVADAYDPAAAQAMLGDATGRYLYHFGEVIRDGVPVWGEHPACAAGIVRERHADQPGSPVQCTFEYSDGGAAVLVAKMQAEPAEPGGPLRWVASGKTVLNNKGQPVKQYEPYYSPAGHRFEEPREVGVTPIRYYDAVGRLVRTEAADGTVARVDITPWQVTSHDANDTVSDPRNAWYSRMSGSVDPAQRRAARLAAAHAGTPGRDVLDSLGRTVVTIAHNRTDGVDAKLVTFTRLDTSGNALWVQDPRGNRVTQHVIPPLPAGPVPYDDPPNLTAHGLVPGYDMAGRLLVEHGVDGGDRWHLSDIAGRPTLTWDARGLRTRHRYDELRRCVEVHVQAAGDCTPAGAPRDPAAPPDPELLVERWVYGERQADPDANLRGRPYLLCDGSGRTTSVAYDFKGNLLVSEHRPALDHRGVPDWSALAGLTDPAQVAAASEAFLEPGPAAVTRAEYDALNRPVVTTRPDGSVQRLWFTEANILGRLEVTGDDGSTMAFVTGAVHDALGRRLRVDYGNGVSTAYEYDPLDSRLTRMRTTRPADPDTTASMLFSTATVVQDLWYTYDAVGNPVRIADAALVATMQAGTAADYVYDALYRLVVAGGREHAGQTGFVADGTGLRDYPFAGARIHPNDLQGLRDYVQRYEYDPAGNIVRMVHHAGRDVEHPGQVQWQRRYRYATDGNRLVATSLPGDPDGTFSATYTYDARGNVTAMPHLPLMRWNYRDQLSASSAQVVNAGTPETTYYAYDSAGRRTRKVTEGSTGAVRNERRYLGEYEVYREYGLAGPTLERRTVRIDDDRERVALMESTVAPVPQRRVRFQVGDRLGRTTVELDEAGALIAYEEFHPYGTTAFQAGRSAAEVGLKRYRYTGRERDEETGFGCHGARYYAPWLGRWVSCDPAGLVDGPSAYAYVRDNPVRYSDHGGREAAEKLAEETPRWIPIVIAGGKAVQAATSAGKAPGVGAAGGRGLLALGAMGLLIAVAVGVPAGQMWYTKEHPVPYTKPEENKSPTPAPAGTSNAPSAPPPAEAKKPPPTVTPPPETQPKVDVKDTQVGGARFGNPPKDEKKRAPATKSGGGGDGKPPKPPTDGDDDDLSFNPPRNPVPPLPADSPALGPATQEARATFIHDQYGRSILGRNPRGRGFGFNKGSSLESRIADDYDDATGILHEFNTTPWSTMSQDKLSFKLKQVAKDLDLIRSGRIKGAIWYGTEDLPTTGLGGQLRKALEDAGIPYKTVPLPPSLRNLRPAP